MFTKVAAPTATGDGFTPETGIVAEYVNSEFNVFSTWVEWLSFGSSAAGLDSHVVETDVSGAAAFSRIAVGGTASLSRAMSVNVNTLGGAGNSTAAEFINNLGGAAIFADSNGANVAILATSTGASAGILGRNVGGGGSGVSGTGDGSGSGVVGTGGDTGEGGTFTGGATSGSGVSGTAVGSFFGVSGISSATSAGAGGVTGIATRNDSVGVAGFALQPGADPLVSSAAGVFGSAVDATAVYAKSVNGYGVWAEGGSGVGPIRAAVHIEPQQNDPIAPLTGDVWFNATQDKLKVRTAGFNMGAWATQSGYSYAFVGQPAQISTISTAFQTVITSTFTAQTEPIAGAVLSFDIVFEMGASVVALAGAEEFEWQVLDITDGAATPIAPRLEVTHVASAVDANERYVAAKAQYTVPASGPRSFELQFRSVTAPVTVRIRRAAMEITGSHG